MCVHEHVVRLGPFVRVEFGLQCEHERFAGAVEHWIEFPGQRGKTTEDVLILVANDDQRGLLVAQLRVESDQTRAVGVSGEHLPQVVVVAESIGHAVPQLFDGLLGEQLRLVQ